MPAKQERSKRNRSQTRCKIVEPKRLFSLRTTRSLGLRLRLNACTILVGLGTTGSTIVDRIVRRTVESAGRLPASLTYFTIDGTVPAGLFDTSRHRRLGVNGCGTDPSEGRAAFVNAYEDIRMSVDQALQTLRAGDPQMPAAVPRAVCVEAWAFAGNGGSSGGMQRPAIQLLNDVLISRRIGTPRTNGVFLGAGMPMQDVNRSVNPSQVEVVSQTAYLNQTRIINDHMNHEPQVHERPDGSTFGVPAGHELWSAAMMDQSNGYHQFGSTEELIEMVSAAYFAAICTHCSTSVEDRVKDLEKLGDTARAMCVSTGLRQGSVPPHR